MADDPERSDGQGARLTHVDESGAARMVDVSAKDVTSRVAFASGRVLVSPEVVRLLRGEGVPKGDALGVARVAGIMAAKRTPELVPLCHPLAISGVTVDLDVEDTAVAITLTVTDVEGHPLPAAAWPPEGGGSAPCRGKGSYVVAGGRCIRAGSSCLCRTSATAAMRSASR